MSPNVLRTLTQSQGPDSYSLDKLTADVAATVKALGHDSCILVAHDCELVRNMCGRRGTANKVHSGGEPDLCWSGSSCGGPQEGPRPDFSCPLSSGRLGLGLIPFYNHTCCLQIPATTVCAILLAARSHGPALSCQPRPSFAPKQQIGCLPGRELLSWYYMCCLGAPQDCKACCYKHLLPT